MFRRILALATVALFALSLTGCNGGGFCGLFRQEQECCDPCGCGGSGAGYEDGGYVSGYGGGEFGGVILGQ